VDAPALSEARDGEHAPRCDSDQARVRESWVEDRRCGTPKHVLDSPGITTLPMWSGTDVCAARAYAPPSRKIRTFNGAGGQDRGSAGDWMKQGSWDGQTRLGGWNWIVLEARATLVGLSCANGTNVGCLAACPCQRRLGRGSGSRTNLARRGRLLLFSRLLTEPVPGIMFSTESFRFFHSPRLDSAGRSSNLASTIHQRPTTNDQPNRPTGRPGVQISGSERFPEDPQAPTPRPAAHPATSMLGPTRHAPTD
jgi:hypothetical protein